MINEIEIRMVDGSAFEYRTESSADDILHRIDEATERSGFVKIRPENYINGVLINTRDIVSIIVTESEDDYE